MAAEQMCVLVTGCSSGFGDVIVRTLAHAGHQVYGTMRDISGRNQEPAARLDQWGRDEGVFAKALELDVRDEGSVQRAIETVLAETGRLDVVVNNAGIAARGPFEAFTMDQIHAIFDTNVYGPLRVDRAALPHMRERGSGLLIHVSSTLGRILPHGGGLYPSSKVALEGVIESLHYEVAPFGVEAILLEPGRFPTPAVGQALVAANEEMSETYAAVRPRMNDLGADADIQEVADAVLALVDAEPGTRPLRTVVGPVFTEGVAEYNAIYEDYRDRLATSLGRVVPPRN